MHKQNQQESAALWTTSQPFVSVHVALQVELAKNNSKIASCFRPYYKSHQPPPPLLEQSLLSIIVHQYIL
ncbi:hypothetical protein BDV3_003435 [Batrachochytrium dendrobatidis]